MDIKFISHLLHLEAEKLRLLGGPLADDLHAVAAKLIIVEEMMPVTIMCEECGGPMVIFDTICPVSQDYQHGYRIIRKCIKCGEMEVR